MKVLEIYHPLGALAKIRRFRVVGAAGLRKGFEAVVLALGEDPWSWVQVIEASPLRTHAGDFEVKVLRQMNRAKGNR